MKYVKIRVHRPGFGPSQLPARRAYSSERGVIWVITFSSSIQVLRRRRISPAADKNAASLIEKETNEHRTSNIE
jgi:hypothetical protein